MREGGGAEREVMREGGGAGGEMYERGRRGRGSGV